MPKSVMSRLILFLLLISFGGYAAGQGPADNSSETVKNARARRVQAIVHQEALKLYGVGLMLTRDNRLVEATQAFERAVKLDPKAACIYRELVFVYLAQDQAENALAACKKAVECDPEDFETWYVYARQLQKQGKTKECIDALSRAVACPGMKGHPEQRAQMFFEMGLGCEAAGDFDRSEKAFREVTKILADPGALQHAFSEEEIKLRSGETYERLGRVCLQAKHYDRAAEAFREAQKQDPSRTARLDFMLANVYRAKGDNAQALQLLNDYIKTQPPGTEAYELRMEVFKALGREREILPSLEADSARDAHNLGLQLLLARQYVQADQAQKAEQTYLKLAAESPAADVYGELFALYKSKGRVAKGLEQLDKAIAAGAEKDDGPGDAGAAARARAMLGVLQKDAGLASDFVRVGEDRLRAQQPLKMETRRVLALLAARSHRLEAAEKFYRDCLQSAPAPQVEAEIYAGLLRILWEANKPASVVETCRKGLSGSEATNRILFHNNLARALILLGKSDEAIAEADESVKLAGDDYRLGMRLFRAEILRSADRYDKAIEECQALLKEAKKPAEIRDIRYTLSNVYSASKQMAKAEEQLRSILEADPNDVGANNDLGYILADQGKSLPEAEEMIRRAIQVDREQKQLGQGRGIEENGDHAAFVDSLGWVLFRRGKVDAACKELEKAATLSEGKEDPVIWDHLGDVYFRLKKPAQARSAWKKAVALYESAKVRRPGEQYKELQHKLKLLESETQQ